MIPAPDARRHGRWGALLLGVSWPLGFAPFHAWPLTIVATALLFALWEGQSPREAAGRGFAFGFGAFAAGTYWFYISLHGFGGAPVPLAAVLMVVLWLALALYPALAGYCAVRWGAGQRALRLCLLWPAWLTLFEWLRMWLLTGFPWLTAGYGQIDGPLRAWAPVVGVYGVTFVALVLAGGLWTLVRGARADRLAAAAALATLAGATWGLHGHIWTQPAGDPLRVSLVQGSISQDRKWLAEQLVPTLRLYTSLTFAEADADLVVWPEVAVPAVDSQLPGFLDELDARARERGVQLYLGILTRDADQPGYRNSLIGLGPQRAAYHKRHLVPFGEFFPVPDFARAWMRSAGLPNQDTVPGARWQAPLPVGDYAMAPSICYEDAFGDEQLDFLPGAQLLVNVSNDAWFGDSLAPHQHLQIARMRALETGRPMLRATNTGVTAVIGADGRIAERLPQFQAAVLRARVTPRTGMTPYARAGNIPIVVICLLAVVAGLVFAWRRSRVT